MLCIAEVWNHERKGHIPTSGSLIVGGKERQNRIENKGREAEMTMCEPPVSLKEKHILEVCNLFYG